MANVKQIKINDTVYDVEDSVARSALEQKAPLESPALTGIPTAPTASNGTSTTQIATTAFVQNAVQGAGSSYTLPVASSTTLGGVKPVAKTSNMTQSVGVDANGALYTVPGGGGTGSGDMLKSVYDPTGTVEQAGGIADYVANNAPVVSVNGKTGVVKLVKADVGLSQVANVTQYSVKNPPPYPVTSVNGKTGDVTIGEVPSVTTADNGKFLRVVNGAWAVAEVDNASGVSF